MTAYAADTWIGQVTLTTSNNVFTVIEDPGGGNQSQLDVAIDAGTYHLHADLSFFSTLPGLYDVIERILTNGTTPGVGTLTVTGAAQNNPTYDFEVALPTSSTGLVNNGLALRAVAFVEDFDVAFSDAAFTMDPRLFGVASDSPGFDVSSVLDTADHVATMPAGTRHRMVTRDLGDGHAITKIREHYKDVVWSSNRPSDSVATIWDEGFVRPFIYQDVRGVEVHQSRALEQVWADTTNRLVADNHAIWFDVWDQLTDGKTMIVVHNELGADLEIDTHKYETVRLRTNLPWNQFANQVSRGGDFYNINVPAWVDPTRSDYDH